MTPKQAFGKILRDARETKGVSQEQLGYASGYHRTYISLLERGIKSPSLDTIFHLAVALKVAPSKMIALVESQNIVVKKRIPKELK